MLMWGGVRFFEVPYNFFGEASLSKTLASPKIIAELITQSGSKNCTIIGSQISESKALLQITEHLKLSTLFKGFLTQKSENPFQRVKNLFWL
jgi:hypothetical protein